MKTLTWRIAPILLLVMLAAFFLYPAPGANFDETYAAVDPATTAALQQFRETNPGNTLELDGRSWRYVSLGRADGTRQTILFLHGMTGAYDIWWRQLTALQNRYHVIALTYPPAGSLREMEQGVLKVLEVEQVKEFHVVGSSLGGYFTQFLVARHADRIGRAVFANTFPPNDIIARKNSTIGALLPYLPTWLIMRVFSGSIVEKVYPAAGHSELVRAYGLEQTHGRMSKEQIVGRFHCVIESFAAPDTGALGVPVMIIEADNDPLVEETLREQLKTTYPRATVRNLSGSGHFPYLNEPEIYTGLLLEFFGNSP